MFPVFTRTLAAMALLAASALGQSSTDACSSVSVTDSTSCGQKCASTSVGGVNCFRSGQSSSQYSSVNGVGRCYCPLCQAYVCGATPPPPPTPVSCSAMTYTFTRSGAYVPAACVEEESCSYKCTAGYSMDISSSCAVSARSTATAAGCTCDTASGTYTDTSNSGTLTFAPGGDTASFTISGNTASVVASTNQGFTCTGTYSADGSSSGSNGSSGSSVVQGSMMMTLFAALLAQIV